MLIGETVSESKTENIFRKFYGATTFIEKSAIPKEYGFKSKKGTEYKGYPDFFLDDSQKDYVIIVETKAISHSKAVDEVQFYMKNKFMNYYVDYILKDMQDRIVKELILPLKESYNKYKIQWDKTQSELSDLI